MSSEDYSGKKRKSVIILKPFDIFKAKKFDRVVWDINSEIYWRRADFLNNELRRMKAEDPIIFKYLEKQDHTYFDMSEAAIISYAFFKRLTGKRILKKDLEFAIISAERVRKEEIVDVEGLEDFLMYSGLAVISEEPDDYDYYNDYGGNYNQPQSPDESELLITEESKKLLGFMLLKNPEITQYLTQHTIDAVDFMIGYDPIEPETLKEMYDIEIKNMFVIFRSFENSVVKSVLHALNKKVKSVRRKFK